MARRGIRRALLAAPKTDPQQELVYFWENTNFYALFNYGRMTLGEAKVLAADMAKHYGLKPPTLLHRRYGKKGVMAESWKTPGAGKLIVNIDRVGWSPILLCHEMAHYIADAKGYGKPDHGAGWLGIYLYLLARYRILPISATFPSARRFKLKFKRKAGPEDL